MRRSSLLVLLVLLCLARAHAQGGPQIILQAGHAARVNGIAFSRDGRRLVTVGDDGVLKLWDLAAHALLNEARGRGAMKSVAMSSDSRLVATGNADGTVTLWETATLTPLHTTMVSEGAPVPTVAFSPDATMLAAGSWHPEERVIKLWDVRTGAELHTLTSNGDETRCVAFSPDGSTLAVGVRGQIDGQNEVELWDTRFGALSRSLKSEQRSVEALAWSPNGRYVAGATIDGSIELWEQATTIWLASMRCGGSLSGLAYAPGGSAIVAGGDRGGSVWSAPQRSMLARLQAGPAGITAIAWSPDGRLVGGGLNDGTVLLWQPSGAFASGFAARDAWAWRPSFMADGTLRITGRRVGSEAPAAAWWDVSGLRVLNPQASTIFAGAQGRPSAVSAVSLTPRPVQATDGGPSAVLGTASENGAVGLWRAAGGQLTRIFPALHPQIAALTLAFNASGGRFAAGLANGEITLFDMQNASDGQPGRFVATLRGHTAPVQCAVWSPDGITLASGGQDRAVRLWDTRGPTMILRVDTPQAVNDLAFSPDGAHLAAAVGEPGYEGQAIVWDLRDGAASPRVISGVGQDARCVAFSTNATLLAVGGADHVVRLFDARNGTLLRAFEGHTAMLDGVALSPDGTVLASGSRDGTVRLWDTRDGTLLLTWTSGPVTSTMARQWIAFDPQGYFVGSDNAGALVQWRIGDEVETTDRHAIVYFRPDLIERILRRAP